MIESKNALEVTQLSAGFIVDGQELIATDNLCFSLKSGEIMGLVGESGCGKSVTSLAIMQLMAKPNGKIFTGQIHLNGTNLLLKSEAEMKKLRGREIAMIFQDPMTALNPVFTCGHQIEELLDIHRSDWNKQKKHSHIKELFTRVGISDPEKRMKNYPHELSGGMRQRVMIAMALACDPKLLIADEPTTALDVTIQAQILDLLRDLVKNSQSSMILVTHDMGVVAETCDNVAVMYAGQIIEYGSTIDVFESPHHPYTEGLLNSIPYRKPGAKKSQRLNTIKGVVPSLKQLPKGCRFEPRCIYKSEKCRSDEPSEVLQNQHRYLCHHPINVES